MHDGMRAQSRHWLDYDPVALVVLVLGIGGVALFGAEHLTFRSQAFLEARRRNGGTISRYLGRPTGLG
jgi:hypothetical protein